MSKRSRWITLAALGLGLVGVGAVLVFAPGDGGGSSTRQADRLVALRAELPPPRSRVLVLGMDGLDWDLVLPWAEAGRMPHLARLLDAGTWGHLDPFVPTLSPLIWTSIATGVSPEFHGILDFVERDPDSRRLIPVTGRSRRVPAVWNIASALGRTVDVVGWWATWPAEPVDGVMVSDRLYYTLVKKGREPELPRDAPGIVHPPARMEELADLRASAVAGTDWRFLRRFMEVSEETFTRAVDAARGMDDPVDGLRRILAATRTYMEAGERLAGGGSDLLMVYLEGTDTLGHLLARYMPPPVANDVAPAQAAVYAAAVPRYFAWVDEWIGRYLESCPLDECTWLVVSDHGFQWGEGRPRRALQDTDRTGPLWHDDDAVFLLAGGGVEGAGRVEPARSVYDVAPTIAALLGLPAGSRWPGRPLPGVEAPGLEPVDYARLLPPRAWRARPEGPAPEDREFLDQLQALGYLDAAATEGHDGADGAPEMTLGALNNLGVLLMEDGRLAEAEELFRSAVRSYPSDAFAHVNLRLLYREQGDRAAATEQLWLAVDKGWHDAPGLVGAVANEHLEAGERREATTLLAEGVRRLPDSAELRLALLTLRTQLGQCAMGLEEARAAVERFPEAARIHGFHGLLAACQGSFDEARGAMRTSLRLDPDQPALREAYTALP